LTLGISIWYEERISPIVLANPSLFKIIILWAQHLINALHTA
jgi:hypothetical protein